MKQEVTTPAVSLNLSRIPLEIDKGIIIESINTNSLNWNLQKTVEESIGLADTLLKAEKNVVANEHVCKDIADLFIQVSILVEIYGAPNIQIFINDRLSKIRNRNKHLSKSYKRVGFNGGLDNNR